LDLEQLLVIGPGGVDHVVLRPRAGLALGELLEAALRALQGGDRGVGGDLGPGKLGQTIPRPIEADLEIERARRCLERGGEYRGPAPPAALRLALPQEQHGSEV